MRRRVVRADHWQLWLCSFAVGLAIVALLAVGVWSQSSARTLVLRTRGGVSLKTPSDRIAFQNTGGGSVRVDETSEGLLLDSAPGAPSSFNRSGLLSLSAHSPITFAVNTTSAGPLTATSSETSTETTTPLPAPDDDITVNAGVTVESTGGDVNLTSGDSIVMQSGSVVKSDTGNVNLRAGSGDNDNDASMSLNGSIQASGTVAITSPGNVCVGSISDPNGTVTINSTGGAITACGSGSLITAQSLALSAANGIGPLNTAVSNLAFSNTTGGAVSVTNTGALAIDPVASLSNSSNAAPGAATTLSANSPLTFEASVSSSGNLSAGTTETSSEATTPLPPPDDDITVNSGATLESTGGDVTLTSADGLKLASGSLIRSDTGNVSLAAGVGDNDNDATWSLQGQIQAPNGTITPQPPSVSITTPPPFAVYPLGKVVKSSFTCTEGTGGPGIATCLDQNGHPSGTAIDTSTVGLHALNVTATSKDGMTGTSNVTYRVASPPSASITTPANGAAYAQGQVVSSSFSCSDMAGGTGIASCVDQNGRPSGAGVDTSTPGQHTFSVTATSRDGLTGTASVTYTVSSPGPAPSPGCQDPAGAYNQGFDAGFNSGFNTGFNSGFNAGFHAGFQVGFTDGFGSTAGRHAARSSSLARTHATSAQATYPACNQQFNQGFNSGFNPGFNSGFQRGFNPGFTSGFKSGFNDGYGARHRR